jgi:hypothetical protein
MFKILLCENLKWRECSGNARSYFRSFSSGIVADSKKAGKSASYYYEYD